MSQPTATGTPTSSTAAATDPSGPTGQLCDWLAGFKLDDAPGAAPYPAVCNGGTPGLCGNGTLDPGEECDPGGSSADGAFDGSPGGAFCTGGRTCTAACVCEDGVTTTTTTITKSTTTITKTTTTMKTTTTTQPGKKQCGNGKLDKWEKCDASAPNGLKHCKSDQGCHPTKCMCVDDGGGTTTTTTLPSDCGNGSVDPGEPCDPSSPGGAFTCGKGETCLPTCECG